MKQFCKILLAFTFVAFTVNNVYLLAQFGGGDGTVNNPYQIATRQHLEALADSMENSPL